MLSAWSVHFIAASTTDRATTAAIALRSVVDHAICHETTTSSAVTRKFGYSHTR